MTSQYFEVRRKILHIFFAFLLIIVLQYFLHHRVLLTQILILGILLSLLQKKYYLPLITPLLDVFEREEEKHFPGKAPIMMVAGALLTELFFGWYLTIIGLLVLAFADSTAHLVGKHFGKIELPWDHTRHLEGRVAGALVAFIILVFIIDLSLLKLGTISILIMLAESLPLRKIGLDDNLVLPFITALLVYSFA